MKIRRNAKFAVAQVGIVGCWAFFFLECMRDGVPDKSYFFM